MARVHVKGRRVRPGDYVILTFRRERDGEFVGMTDEGRPILIVKHHPIHQVLPHIPDDSICLGVKISRTRGRGPVYVVPVSVPPQPRRRRTRRVFGEFFFFGDGKWCRATA